MAVEPFLVQNEKCCASKYHN